MAQRFCDEVSIFVCGSIKDQRSALIDWMISDRPYRSDNELNVIAAADVAQVRLKGVDKFIVQHFTAANCKFAVIASTRNNECIREVACGAMCADALVVLTDDDAAGISAQIRRDVSVASLIGVKKVILAVNKTNRAAFGQEEFSAIASEFGELAQIAGITQHDAIPVSTITGENIIQHSGRNSWYEGNSLVEALCAASTDFRNGTFAADRISDAADQFAAHIVWLDEQPMLPERRYEYSDGNSSAIAQITQLTHRIDLETQSHMAAKILEANEIGYCKLSLDRPVLVEAGGDKRRAAGFTLNNQLDNAIVGVGVIQFTLRRAHNVVWQTLKIDKLARSAVTGQKPCIIWFTGLSGSGKSTIADCVEQKLQARGRLTYLLDGDNIRHGLNRDLGFTDQDRVENIRRVAEVAKLMVDAGLVVIVSFISPFRSERRMARELVQDGEFFEIFVDAPLAVCEARDPKGLYKKARKGDLLNFTGIDSPYEPPEAAELTLDTTVATADQAAEAVIALLPDCR